MKKLLLLITALTLLCNNAVAQFHIDKKDVKTFATTQKTTPHKATIHPAKSTSDDGVAEKVYGIRVYDDAQGAVQQFVSFDINNTNSITLEKDLSDYYIRAAAEAEGYYYMINSRDGLCAYDLLAMDMMTLAVDTIASYDIMSHESALIFLDMTYDATTKTMYGIGYDLDTAISEDDESVEVLWALVKVDLTSGSITNVGTQGYCNIITVAADAEGYLWGLDNEGNLWDINKRNGKPGEAYGYTIDIPTSLQSMTFNPSDGNLYWTGFKIDNSTFGETGKGFFSKFCFTEDAIEYKKISDLSENAEIIGLYIDPEPIPGDRPTAVSQLVITPAAEGAAQATLSWTNPSTLINGEVLPNGFSVLIYRDDALVKTLTNQTAGAQTHCLDENIDMGLHTYKVVCSNDAGEGKPCIVKNIFIGRDVPCKVDNLKATKTAGKDIITLTWDKPRTGKNNGWYDESTLTYRIVRQPDNKVMAESITETSIIDTDFTLLQGYSYDIVATTIDGEGVMSTSNTVVVGPALDVPYECDFGTEEEIALWSILNGDNDDHQWFPASYSSTGQTFMKFAPDSKYNPETPADDWLITPPLRLKAGVTYAFEYEMFLLGPLFPVNYDITIGREATIEAQSEILYSIDSLEINMEFIPKRVVFKVEEDGEYYLGYHIRNAVLVQVTDVNIRELDAIDLAVESVNYNKIGNVNKEHQFNVTVKNDGADNVPGYVINIVDENNNLITSFTSTYTLEAQTFRQEFVTWTPTETGKHTLYAVVEIDGDAIPENNTSSPFDIEIVEEGEWAHVQHNNALMNYTPIIPSLKYSRSATIYYDNEIYQYNQSLKEGEWNIIGLIYYTYVFNNLETQKFNAKISLANTEIKELDGTDQGIQYTEVFSGTITPTSTTTEIYIPFDTPFYYSGGNLVVKAQHTSRSNDYNLMFYGSRDDSGIWRMWYYGDDTSEFNADLIQFDTEIANISLMFVNNTSISNTKVNNNISAYISYGNLFTTGEYDILNIYSIDGTLCESYTTSQLYIPMMGYSRGVYIIEIIKDGIRSTSKVMLR